MGERHVWAGLGAKADLISVSSDFTPSFEKEKMPRKRCFLHPACGENFRKSLFVYNNTIKCAKTEGIWIISEATG